MDWQTLIIPLIGVAVWLISMMLGRENDSKRPARPQPPRPPEEPSAQSGSRSQQRPARSQPPEEPSAQSGSRSQRTSAELDRFLEEVRRRQQPQAPRPRDPEQPRPQPVPRPVARIPAPAKPVRAPEPARARSIPILEALPTPTSTLPTQTLPVVAAPTMPELTTVTVDTPRRVTEAVHQVRAMLKDPKSLAAAVVLREIFDPPVSRRPRRRR